MVEQMTENNVGQLANNGTTVLCLQTSLSRSEMNVRIVPDLIRRLAEDDSWREFLFPDHPEKVYRWNAADFRRFIESPRPAGCETPIHVLERMLRDTDIWETFLELTRGKPGAQPGEVRNPKGSNQFTEEEDRINCDSITVNPIDTNSPPPTGTSVSYALRRLSRERPELYERVKSGDLTANAAMIEAGFREAQITLPLDPRKAARRLVKHMSREQFSRLVDEAIGLYAATGK